MPIELKKYLLFAWLGFFLLGGVLYTVAVRHNTRHNWYIARTPLTLEAGEEVHLEFEAELDTQYALELQVSRSLPREAQYKYIRPTRDGTPLDMDWTVRENGAAAAQGSASGYLYMYAPTWKRRAWNFLVREPNQYGLIPGRMGRGIGRFDAKAGETYDVTLRVNEGIPALRGYEPELLVRVSRNYIQHYYNQHARTSGAACAFLLAGAACFLLWLVPAKRAAAGHAG